MTLTPQNDKELICLTNCFAARLSWKRKGEAACVTQITVNKRTRSGRDSVVMIVIVEENIILTSKALFNVNGLKLFSKSRAVAENVWHSLSTLLWNVTSDVEGNLKSILIVSITPKNLFCSPKCLRLFDMLYHFGKTYSLVRLARKNWPRNLDRIWIQE